MSFLASKTIELNLDTSGIAAQVYVDQYDSGSRRLFLKLYHSEAPYIIPANCSITLSGTKPGSSGKKFSFVQGCSYTSNVVTADLRQQMTIEAGTVTCGLTIADMYGAIIGSVNFNLIVQESELTSGSFSSSDIDYIQQALHRIQGIDALANQVEDNRVKITEIKDYLVNIKDYGAKGNGVTDDYNAIQTCMNANAGKTIYFPAGTYKLSTPLQIPKDRTTLIGNNAMLRSDQSCIMRNAADGKTGGTTANEYISISGFYFVPTDGTANCASLVFGHAQHIVVRDCKFWGNEAWPMIKISSCYDVVVDACLFSNAGKNVTSSELIQIDYMRDATNFPWFGPYDSAPCVDVRITNCNFTGNLAYVKQNSGEPVAIGGHMYSGNDWHVRQIKVSNNYFLNMGGIVRFFEGKDILVDSNSANGCYSGFCVPYVKDSSGNQTKVTNITVSNNIFDGFMDTGIAVPDKTLARGVAVYGKSGSFVALRGNTIRGFNGIGVSLESDHNVVMNNFICYNGLDGVVIGFSEKNAKYSGNYICLNNMTATANKKDVRFAFGFSSNTSSDIGDIMFDGNKMDTMVLEGMNPTEMVYIMDNVIKESPHPDSTRNKVAYRNNFFMGTYSES